jgi:two-component system response regulator RegA
MRLQSRSGGRHDDARAFVESGAVKDMGNHMVDLVDAIAALPDKSLLVLDDDTPLRTRLGRALEQRGFEVALAAGVAEAIASIKAHAPAFAVLDMRLEDGSGLKVVEAVRDARPDARVIMLTGYGNIATAVAAVKAGAVDYLAKPADADDVARALLAQAGDRPPPPENPMSADRVRWEHIQRVYELCGHNVSETARRLNMHRRTLQRILAKRAPK